MTPEKVCWVKIIFPIVQEARVRFGVVLHATVKPSQDGVIAEFVSLKKQKSCSFELADVLLKTEEDELISLGLFRQMWWLQVERELLRTEKEN